MSSRRTPAGVTSEQQIADLVAQLRQLIPENRRNQPSNMVSAPEVLQETCNYITSLRRQVNDLSERLSRLLSTMDQNSDAAAAIRRSLAGD